VVDQGNALNFIEHLKHGEKMNELKKIIILRSQTIEEDALYKCVDYRYSAAQKAVWFKNL